MAFTLENLMARLAPRSIRFFEQIGSTQDAALAWLREGAASGAVVIADEQTEGRGRLKREWRTPPGSALAMSVILRPESAGLPQMTMLGALAIADVLDSLDVPDVTIKWPNDVKVGGRKVCGLLPEVVWEGDNLAGVVLGIGVNVGVDFSGTTLAGIAVSVNDVVSAPVDRIELAAMILDRLDAWERHLGTAYLVEQWRARLETLGQRVTIRGAERDGILSGVAEAVDDDGVLYLRTDDGVRHRIVAGDALPDA